MSGPIVRPWSEVPAGTLGRAHNPKVGNCAESYLATDGQAGPEPFSEIT